MLHKAFEYYGLREIVGKEHNAQIIEFFQKLGYDINDDETPWCAAWLNYVLMVSGYEYTGKLNARSWLNIGKPVSTPMLGDVVIFWRGSKEGEQGHVGIFINKIGSTIYVLGGNQGNQVNISAYSDKKLLGYRRIGRVKESKFDKDWINSINANFYRIK